MHLYFLARGKRAFVRRFLENLEFVMMRHEYEKGKFGQLQLVPREVKIIELAFPEPCKDQVLDLIGNDTMEIPGKHGSKHLFQKLMPYLSKILKLQPIPKLNKDNKNPKINRDNVGVYLIGTKKDHFDDGIEKI